MGQLALPAGELSRYVRYGLLIKIAKSSIGNGLSPSIGIVTMLREHERAVLTRSLPEEGLGGGGGDVFGDRRRCGGCGRGDSQARRAAADALHRFAGRSRDRFAAGRV